MNESDWVEARSNRMVHKGFKQLAVDAEDDLERYDTLDPRPTQSQRYHVRGEDDFDAEPTGVHRVVLEIKNDHI